MNEQQQQAVEMAVTTMFPFKMSDHSLIKRFASTKIGEHIITNPSDFGLPDPEKVVSKEEMFEFVEWANHSRWVYYQSDMIWIIDQKWEEGITTSELFEIYTKAKTEQK